MPGFDEPSRWQPEDFAWAQEQMRESGIFCNASETGLAAEFPWEPGAVSAITNGKTSLLQLDSKIAHPTAGSGLAFRLVLPVSGSRDELLDLADTLNLLEIGGVDVPPNLGAWSVAPQFHSVAYTGF